MDNDAPLTALVIVDSLDIRLQAVNFLLFAHQALPEPPVLLQELVPAPGGEEALNEPSFQLYHLPLLFQMRFVP
jgi:hypothetical protein